jgi:hypothetical protein
MVGHQQPGADQEARRVTQQIGACILELNATNRARRERTLGKVVDAVEIVALDDPLEPDLSRQDVGDLLKELALAELLFSTVIGIGPSPSFRFNSAGEKSACSKRRSEVAITLGLISITASANSEKIAVLDNAKPRIARKVRSALCGSTKLRLPTKMSSSKSRSATRVR